jgi:hypothetical protein
MVVITNLYQNIGPYKEHKRSDSETKAIKG